MMDDVSRQRVQLNIELFLSAIVSIGFAMFALSNILTVSNSMYPGATDFLGHMAKVDYVAKAIMNREIVSWHPHWYCGTTVTQYYPPLSIYLLALFQIVTKNVMLTFKLYNILMLSLGGMGVWLICRRYIGEWVGVVGSFAYIAQPFILLTLLDQGQVAQGPIIALNPWYLLILLELIRDMSRSKFILATILCSVMILSHPNSIFMAALCVAITLVGLLFYGETKLHIVIIVGLSIMFAGLLTAFWSLVGVTGLENPTIPFLLGEAVKLHSATFEWFTSPLHYFYFALSGQAASVISILTILIRKKSNSERSFNHNALTFLSFLYIISIIFSFGLALPFFKYIPLAQSMVAGRILALTSIPSAFFVHTSCI